MAIVAPPAGVPTNPGVRHLACLPPATAGLPHVYFDARILKWVMRHAGAVTIVTAPSDPERKGAVVHDATGRAVGLVMPYRA